MRIHFTNPDAHEAIVKLARSAAFEPVPRARAQMLVSDQPVVHDPACPAFVWNREFMTEKQAVAKFREWVKDTRETGGKK